MSGDLISRNELLKNLDISPDEWAKGRTIERIIREAPSVDAVQVVRCRDCDMAEDIGKDYLICVGWGFRTDFDGFCYKGKKRDKEE